MVIKEINSDDLELGAYFISIKSQAYPFSKLEWKKIYSVLIKRLRMGPQALSWALQVLLFHKSRAIFGRRVHPLCFTAGSPVLLLPPLLTIVPNPGHPKACKKLHLHKTSPNLPISSDSPLSENLQHLSSRSHSWTTRYIILEIPLISAVYMICILPWLFPTCSFPPPSVVYELPKDKKHAAHFFYIFYNL